MENDKDNSINSSCSNFISNYMKSSESKQVVNYHEIDSRGVDTNNAVKVDARNVTIIPSSGKHTLGSSKVKLRNIIDYSWEKKDYTGEILTVHVSGTYIAYSIKNLAGKDEFANFRVLNLKKGTRTLVKGFGGLIQDIAFAIVVSPVLLACVDSIGNVRVYSVTEDSKAIECTLQLKIEHDVAYAEETTLRRIFWCPFVPDEENYAQDQDEEATKLIVTHGSKAHVWNVGKITVKQGFHEVIPKFATDLDGFYETDVKNCCINDVAFSPDGSTYALACSDGFVRFYQISTKSETPTPELIHSWSPHDGKSVSRLLFLDNYLGQQLAFWKFALTGTEGNTEIKIWSCETWECIQTINYAPVKDETTKNVTKLRVVVDITSSYMFVSDMQRKLLFVHHLQRNETESIIKLYKISEFSLSTGILSFGVIQAEEGHINDAAITSFDGLTQDEISDEISPTKNKNTMTIIKLYYVQPKGLHECNIVYDSSKPLEPTYESDVAIAQSVPNQIVERQIEVENLFVASDLDRKLNNKATTVPKDKFLTVAAIEERKAVNESYLKQLLMSAKKDESESVEGEIDANEVLVNGHRSNVEIGRNDLDMPRETSDVCGDDIINVGSKMIAPTFNEDVVSNGDYRSNGATISSGSSPSQEVYNILLTNDEQRGVEESLLSETKEERITPVDSLMMHGQLASLSNLYAAQSAMTGLASTMNKRFEKMEHQMSQLMNVVQNQQQNVIQCMDVLQKKIHSISQEQSSLKANITAGLTTVRPKTTTMNSCSISALEEKTTQDLVISRISENVNSFMRCELDNVIKLEVNKVMTNLEKNIDKFCQKTEGKLQQQITSTNQSLKDNIVEMVLKKDKVLKDAVLASVPTVLNNVFAEVFAKKILPKFEKSCAEMFSQVNNLFVSGIDDFKKSFDNHAQMLINQANFGELDNNLSKLLEMQKSTSHLLYKTLEPEFHSIKQSIDENRKYFESCIMNIPNKNINQNASSNAPVQPPIITVEQMDHLIAQGKFEEVIDKTLSAVDLKLLITLCQKLDPNILFEKGVITQRILLVFIQQLSINISEHTELKHKFLSEAICNIDRKHPICQNHLGKILPGIRQNISQYILSYPNTHTGRNMKMLLMAIDSLLTEKVEVR